MKPQGGPPHIEASTLSAELEDFLKDDFSGSGIPASLAGVAKKIEKDLVASPLSIGLKYTGLLTFGFLVSLFICAQRGVGLSFLSFQVFDHLMDWIPPQFCGAICGALFSAVPFVLLLVVLNRFEQRYLLFRMWWLVASLPIVAAAGMLFYGNLIQNSELSFWGWSSSWTLCAIVTPYIFEALLYIFALRQKKIRFDFSPNERHQVGRQF